MLQSKAFIHCITHTASGLSATTVCVPLRNDHTRRLFVRYATLTELGWTGCIGDLPLWLQLDGASVVTHP